METPTENGYYWVRLQTECCGDVWQVGYLRLDNNMVKTVGAIRWFLSSEVLEWGDKIEHI